MQNLNLSFAEPEVDVRRYEVAVQTLVRRVIGAIFEGDVVVEHDVRQQTLELVRGKEAAGTMVAVKKMRRKGRNAW